MENQINFLLEDYLFSTGWKQNNSVWEKSNKSINHIDTKHHHKNL